MDMSMRVASLDYLGIVAARLRKDAISSRLNTEGINEILSKVSFIEYNLRWSHNYKTVLFIFQELFF